MQRRLNFKLIGITLGTLLVLAVLTHFLHQYQLRQNAYRLLGHGDRAMLADAYDKAESYYAQYLEFVPEDADTMQKYAQVLDRRAASGDRVQLIVKMEQVLRVKPDEHAFRLRLVHNLILLDHLPEAIEHLKKLLGRSTDQAEVQHMLGWCQEARKEYTQAAESFREALKLNPHQIKSYSLLSEVLQDRLNQPDEALKVMDEMVQANASSYQAYLLRARFQRRRGEEKEAESDLQTALKLGPHQPDVILEVAEVARVKQQIAEAVRLLEDGAQRYPDDPDFYQALAQIKIQQGEKAAAIAHLQEGLRHAPKAYELAVLMIDLMIDQGDARDADRKIQELLDAGMRPTLPNYLTARLRIADKQWGEAIKLLEGVRAELGSHSVWQSRVQLLLGLCYQQTGDLDQELLAFRQAVHDEPSWMLANLGLGSALVSNGRAEEAVNLLEPLATGKDTSARYWILLARALLERQQRTAMPGAWAKIEQALTKAADAQPDAMEVPILRAELLAAQKQYAGAEALLQKTKMAHPHEIQVWCALAELAARQNHWQEAETILDQTAAQPDFADHLEWRLAKVRLWSRHGTRADLDKLSRLSDDINKTAASSRLRLRRELADTWYRLGNRQRAEQFWRAIAQELPKDLPSRSGLLELALEKNQPQWALHWRDEIRQIEGSESALARYSTAAILVHDAHGRRAPLQEARKILDGLKQHQDWPRVALLSGTIYEMEGQYQHAIQDYTRALELGATQPQLMTRLMQLLLERREFGKAEAELANYEQKLPLTRDLARLGAEAAVGMRDKNYAKVALQRAEAAVALPTRDYRELLWLAHICEAAGENARAEKLLRDSVQLAGHTPDTWIALVEHLMQTNQQAQAQKELDRLRQELPKERQPLALARCYEAMQRPDDAERALQSGLKEQPNDFALVAFAADFERRAERVDEARKLYEQLLTPELAAPAEFAIPARRHLAVLLAQHGTTDATRQALALLDVNRRLRGVTVADERIRLFIQAQQPNERQAALNKFQDTLARQAPAVEERLLLAQMLEAADRLGPARAHLSDLAEEHPHQALYLSRFARVLIKTGELDEAQTLLTRLERLEPKSRRVRDLQAALSRAKE